MTTPTVIIVVLVLAALAGAAFVMYQKQRRVQLQQRFGPEYDRAVEGADSRREAESHLADVAHRRDKLDLRDLDETERARYSTEWEAIQAQFVDAPGQAVDAADGLITTVMRVRGYPVEDFAERADLVAADHPEVVAHYREAHAAHQRHRSAADTAGDADSVGGVVAPDGTDSADRASADRPDSADRAAPAARTTPAGGDTTEDLRQSFVHYRALFAALVEDKAADRPDPSAQPQDSQPTHSQETR